MRSQIEKNKEAAMDKIEEYSEKPFSDSVAEHLNVYRGAYKALCMVGKGEDTGAAEYAEKAPKKASVVYAEKSEHTPELDGDSEFERVIMKIPADRAHMVKLTHVFDKHLSGLKIVNSHAYNTVIDQLKELAKS